MSENIFITENRQTSDKDIMQEDFNYTGYQVVRGEFFSHLFEPSITFNNEKVSVNSACINKMPDAWYVQILVNPTEKKLAIKPCSEEMKDSFCWVSKQTNGKRKPKTITCRVFFAKVTDLMGWDPSFRYKILGKAVRTPTEHLLVFDLNSAETYLKKKDAQGENTRTPYYPKHWMNQFGTPVSEHQNSVLVEIFDDYAVFMISKDEEQRGKRDDSDDDTGYEKEEDTFESEYTDADRKA